VKTIVLAGQLQGNGVQATVWVVVAELDPREIPPVLSRLADADVGAYAAPLGGHQVVPTATVLTLLLAAAY
jgi:hypothetical protein